MGDTEDIALSDLDSLEGVELAGRFRLRRMLGRGGYGAVFEAEQTSVQRQCAVKVLVPHVAADPRNTRRFEREARATSQLAHPNTVVIYDFGLDHERRLLFLAMEFIEGESLRELIRREGTLDLTRTLWIAHQAARSLQDAHDRGLVHRDVKPHNIMITNRGGDSNFVKVIDFGIAKFLDARSVRESMQQVTATGMVVGTPSYMAPEQVRNASLDGRTDQYALATCVYEMLTGRTVFVGESPVDIATRQLTRSPLPIRTLNPALDVSHEFEQTLLRALSKEADDRFDSIREFADQLFESSGVAPPFSVDTGEQIRDPGEQATESLDFAAPSPEDTTADLPESVDPIGDTVGLRELDEHPSPDDDPPNRDAEATTEPRAVPEDDVPGHTLAVHPGGAETTEEDHWTLGERPAAGRTEVSPVARGPRRAVLLALVAGALTVVVAIVVIGFLARGVRPADDPSPSSSNDPTSTSAAAAPQPDPRRDQEANDEPDRQADDGPEEEPKRDPRPDRPRTHESEERREPPTPPPTEDPEPTPQPDPPADVEAELEPGVLTVTTVPWGDLWVDGRRRGGTGRTRLELAPGKHRLELRQNGSARASKTVDVEPGQSKMIELIAR